MDIDKFKHLPVLGILRGVKEHMIAPLAETVIKAGLESIEITMNTDNAAKLIKEMINEAKGRLAVGAGTVLSMNDLKDALNAGASFIVMPVIIDDVMDYCTKNSIPVFPGAVTPNEVFKAWELGATMVKVFPVKDMGGPDYIKELKGPLDKIEMLACAGVNKDNLNEYFQKGSSAVSFGGGIFNLTEMDKNNYSSVEKDVSDLINAYKSI